MTWPVPRISPAGSTQRARIASQSAASEPIREKIDGTYIAPLPHREKQTRIHAAKPIHLAIKGANNANRKNMSCRRLGACIECTARCQRTNPRLRQPQFGALGMGRSFGELTAFVDSIYVLRLCRRGRGSIGIRSRPLRARLCLRRQRHRLQGLYRRQVLALAGRGGRVRLSGPGPSKWRR